MYQLYPWLKLFTTAAPTKFLQSCSTLRDPRDGSPPGSPVPGTLQARTLEWVAISSSNAWKWSRSVVSDSQRPHGPQPTRLLRPWDFPGRSNGVGCHCLFSVLFLSWLWAKSSSGCSLYARLLAKILKYAAYVIDHCSWVQRFLIQTQSSTPSKCLLLLTCLGILVWWLRLGQERGMIGLYRWNYDSECFGLVLSL